MPNSIRRNLFQVIFFATRINIVYLSSIEKRAMIAYLLKHQFTEPLLSINMNPDRDFLMTLLPAQSKSEYLSIFSPVSLF